MSSGCLGLVIVPLLTAKKVYGGGPVARTGCGSAVTDGGGATGDRGDLGNVSLLSSLVPSPEKDQWVWRVCLLGLPSEQTLADSVPTKKNKIS